MVVSGYQWADNMANLPEGFVLDPLPDEQPGAALPPGFELDPVEQPPVDEPGTIFDPLAQGITFGFSDELAGALGATMAYLSGNIPEGQTIEDAYREIRDIARGQTEAFRERSPKAALAAEIIGGLGTGGAGLARGVGAAGRQLAGRGIAQRGIPAAAAPVATGAGVGAAEGALAGLGYTEGETLEEMARDVAEGAAVGAGVGAVGGKILDVFSKRSDTKAEIARILEQEPTAVEAAGARLVPTEEAGTLEKFRESANRGFSRLMGEAEEVNQARQAGARVAPDTDALETIRQGFDPGVIAPVQGATPATSQKLLKMTEMMEKGQRDKLYQMANRPADVAGDSLNERLKHVLKVNRQAAKRLDGVAKNLKGKQVQYDDVIADFTENLENAGINLEPNPKTGRLEPNFQGSDIEGLTGVENFVTNIIKRMTDTKAPDAYDLHRLKKFIDENVSYSKRTEGLTGRMESIVKGLRRGLDKRLDDTFKEYDEVNTTYADTRGAIDDLQAAVGNRLDLTGATADKALGQEMRKLMSNYKSRVSLLEAIPVLEDIANKYGKTFDDDLMLQALFVDELNRQFGSVARTSLAKEVEKGVEQAITPMNAVINMAAEQLESARGINDAGAFDAMKRLLRRQAARAQAPEAGTGLVDLGQ